jgi:hypothetical protein
MLATVTLIGRPGQPGRQREGHISRHLKLGPTSSATARISGDLASAATLRRSLWVREAGSRTQQFRTPGPAHKPMRHVRFGC